MIFNSFQIKFNFLTYRVIIHARLLIFARVVSHRASPDPADPPMRFSVCGNIDQNNYARDSSDRLNGRRRWFGLVDLKIEIINHSSKKIKFLPSIHNGPYRLLPDIAIICSRNLSIGTYPTKFEISYLLDRLQYN